MNAKEAFEAFNKLAIARTQDALSEVETEIFLGIWERQTYEEIADRHYRSRQNVKQNASKKLFSRVREIWGIDVKVGKKNFKPTVEQLLLEDSRSKENWESSQSDTKIDEGGISNYFYLEPDKLPDCYKKIVEPGALIRIKSPKKMGKTLLMNEVLDYASKKGYQTVKLNIRLPEQAVIENLKSFLLWLCNNVDRRLKMPDKVAYFWKEYRGANDNCTIYFEEYILSNIDAPLVLGLDNVDRVFQYPDVAADFFGLLRSWFEDAKVIHIWRKIRLVVAYSTEVYIPLNINNSPFNVGEFVELPEFNSEQVGLLATRCGLNLEPIQIDKLMALVGGHPYLVKTALESLKNQPDVSLEEVLLAAPTNAGIYRHYLTEINQYLQENSQLAAAFKKVVEGEEAVRLTDEEAFKLDSLGLVRKYGNNVTLRCDLYRQYFADRLI